MTSSVNSIRRPNKAALPFPPPGLAETALAGAKSDWAPGVIHSVRTSGKATKPFAEENQMKNGITGALRLSVILASVFAPFTCAARCTAHSSEWNLYRQRRRFPGLDVAYTIGRDDARHLRSDGVRGFPCVRTRKARSPVAAARKHKSQDPITSVASTRFLSNDPSTI